MKVKVCGLKQIRNINEIADAGADLAGIIFYSKSPRFVSDSLDFDEVRNVKIKKAGVFVNENTESIVKKIANYGLDFVQLHGNESPEVCKELMSHSKVIKAFGIDSKFDFEKLNAYKGCVDYFLFDTATPNYGGSGKSFDYDLLTKYDLNIPFIISGGISAGSIQAIRNIKHKHLYGVDINSRFEISPGLKDVKKVEQFIKQLR